MKAEETKHPTHSQTDPERGSLASRALRIMNDCQTLLSEGKEGYMVAMKITMKNIQEAAAKSIADSS